MADTARQRRLRRNWDRQADGYDRQMAGAEQRFFGDTRPWLCGQATGDVLEVAIGSGLNLPHYPAGTRLVGVEWSPAMLDLARRRAEALALDVDLRSGDAQALELPDASFDTVVCTFGLCAIPDERAALREMARVLRPGGLLLLADHVRSSWPPVRAVQALVDLVSVPLYGEHFGRRPARRLPALGFTIEQDQRSKLGMIERLTARRP